MIISFRDKRLKRLYDGGETKQLPPELVERVEIILARLDTAKEISYMDIHSYRLHLLKGKFKDYWAVTVRANWRIIFRFEDGNVFDVELIDYH